MRAKRERPKINDRQPRAYGITERYDIVIELLPSDQETDSALILWQFAQSIRLRF